MLNINYSQCEKQIRKVQSMKKAKTVQNTSQQKEKNEFNGRYRDKNLKWLKIRLLFIQIVVLCY